MNNKVDKLRRSIGVTLQDGQASMVVWAPLAKSISIVTDSTKYPLQKNDQGYWRGISNKLVPGDRYRIEINDEKTIPDPASLSQPEGVHQTSEVLDLTSFSWTDGEWKNLPLAGYILYELHIGTFTAGGTFKDAEEKLDHLVDLGITAIEVMPVAQFPGKRNWGYDGVFPFAVQHSYGGAKAFQHFVNACHSKGLAVILDTVYNHFGPEGFYANELGPYFTTKYKTPWNNAINYDDAWSDGVRHFFIENALMWLRDFHIDGLRLDAVHAIYDSSPLHILKEIRLCADQLEKATLKTFYLLAETDLNDPKYIQPVTSCGYGMHAQWMDEFHHSLRVACGGEKIGYYSDFNGLGHLAKSYKDAYVYDGQFSAHRRRVFGAKAETNPGEQFIVFSQNHDQIGNRMLGERSSQLMSFEMQKLMAGAVIVSPFIPLLFMGEEWSEPNPFLYFVDHSDQELIEAVRKGRKEEFSAFHTEGDAPDAFAQETFQKSKLQWHLLKEEKHRTMLHYYQALLRLKKELSPLGHDRKNIETTISKEKGILMLHRWNDEMHCWCFLNFSSSKQAVEWLPAYKIILDSASTEWQGPGHLPGDGKNLLLQPESIIIISDNV